MRTSMAILPALLAMLLPASAAAQEAAPPAAANGVAPRVVFVGNSFTFGAGSPVRLYRAETVTDLNGEGIGGVPALFKMFSKQAGRDFDVSLETASGKNLDFHVRNKAAVLDQHWDFAVLQGHSMLDPKKPGDRRQAGVSLGFADSGADSGPAPGLEPDSFSTA